MAHSESRDMCSLKRTSDPYGTLTAPGAENSFSGSTVLRAQPAATSSKRSCNVATKKLMLATTFPSKIRVPLRAAWTYDCSSCKASVLMRLGVVLFAVGFLFDPAFILIEGEYIYGFKR